MIQKLYKPLAVVASVTASLLLIPLIAMLVTGEVNWTLFDFVAAGILLFGTGFTYVLVTRVLAPSHLQTHIVYRVAVGFSMFTGLFLVWTNLAVGVIGTEDNPINGLYFGVILVGFIGALISRFRPLGLQRTMFAMALAQALIAVIALVSGVQSSPDITAIHVIGVNGFFIALFSGAALMFRNVMEE